MLSNGIARNKRSLQQGRRAAEDSLYEAEHHVKKHPLGTVGTAVGVGLGLSAVIGFLLSRNLCTGK